MQKKWNNSSPPSRRAGLTLIEVIAAIAILGTLLVGIVLAKSRHTQQIALTQRQNDAVRAADELIASWWVAEQGFPIGQWGALADDPTMVWETEIVRNAEVDDMGARVLRLQLSEARVDLADDPADAVLVTVDLVIPLEQKRSDLESNPQAGGADE